MGQYYKPINIDTQEYVYSHDYSNGLKLMEHSYIGNRFVQVVEKLLSPSGEWHKCRLVWAGDYADGEPNTKKNPGNGEWLNLYSLVEQKIKPKVTKVNFRYLINYDYKCFVDKNKIKKDNDGFKINPLPLLTCEGNGRGGGDFHSGDSRVGSWARCHISTDNIKPKEYEECDGQFIEE